MLEHSKHSTFDDYDLADFAQEFLRRNGDYRERYAELFAQGGHTPDFDAATSMARAWGLVLPG